ncbi:helix-turn-helix transcriptional regulator [Streptomyces sp. CB02460]|uniref:helix-turn-helix transcriptional regulator n=1 Tax=Streptomyces sp. CB02460 TaxID=1703941 RepID=UPI00093EE03C|nr:helix-turn-helix transcriptional regulator [Streptomyces sp. CB02460]OKJ73071.1 XRE family transcriptional regulator [Streptomyces sp. CB02460]
MDNREEVREFLTSRRAKISPERAGLPAGSRRRVPGLRRSEVAALADMSVEYYSKLERGQLAGVSPPVLEAVARALQLDDAERAHLLNLARAADGSDVLIRPKRRRTKGQWTPHRSLQWMLDAITAGPALVRNGRMDVLAANPLARAFYADLHADPGNQANLARFQFLDPAARRFYPDWERFADMCVPILRTEAGRNPHDKDLHDLVGELSTRSEEFRTRWGAHNVRHHGTGTKRFHHQAVGELTLAFEDLEMTAAPGLTVTVYTAEPGSPSEEGLRLLASWAATREAQQAPQHSP